MIKRDYIQGGLSGTALIDISDFGTGRNLLLVSEDPKLLYVV